MVELEAKRWYFYGIGKEATADGIAGIQNRA